VYTLRLCVLFYYATGADGWRYAYFGAVYLQ